MEKLNIEGHATLGTAIGNFLTAVVYGVVMAVIDFYLDKKTRLLEASERNEYRKR